MKMLVFADIHGHNFREFSYIDEDGFNSRLLEQALVLEEIYKSAKEHKVDMVLFLGDLTQLKNNVDTQVVRTLMMQMEQICNTFPTGILPGNHDYRMWTKDPVLLEMIHDWDDRLILFNNESFYSIRGFESRFYALPYTRALSGLNKQLEGLKSNPEKDIFIGHEYTIGMRFGSYVIERGLDADILSKKFRLSLLGHNHNRKAIKPNVYSVGAPMQHTFSDVGETRGWWILDTDAWEMDFVENNFSPKFWKVKVDEKDKSFNLPGDKEKDYYWITVKGSKFPERLKSVRWKRVNFELENTMKDRIDMKISDSTDDIIEKYVKAQNTKLDKKKLSKVGRKYL